ncbi:GxxExxY protein [Bacteroides sp. OttesenSCG-928-J23]|nr:GxxExxY protein [Bacteroides sp. OttesenSCG-928-N06]MDL2247541.1 GxxExxY protein [Bacteroides sp. OttesenSCG-928-J23]MDL2299096.1 GxxExxY protein [Bacteroides sp. OttesenSCG-928-E20]MDL2304133.1 GxxExxY protein [Bacteroides sp. OttesenSCG-928-D19]
MKHEELTEEIIGAFFKVYNALGHGFLEQVYQNALYKELNWLGLKCEAQKEIKVYYRGELVGRYVADMVIEGLVILELKAVKCLLPEHEAQLINYLKATDIEVGLLMNFGEKPEFERRIFSNDTYVEEDYF